MRRGGLVRLLFVLLAVLACLAPSRASAYAPPALQGAVTDTSGTLTKADRDALEARLRAYRERTTNEVVVFLLASLGGESVDDVAYGAFNTWKVGKKGKDNGVLLVLAVNDRKMRIETGKGIGDKLTDVESGRILRERIGPFLKQQRWKAGIEAGLDAIEAALDGRPAPPIPDPNAKASATEPDPDTAEGAAILMGRKLAPSRLRIFDRTQRFSADEVAVANQRIQGEWRAWDGVAVVLVPSSAAFTDVTATTIRRQVGSWPVVVQVGLDDRKVNVAGTPTLGDGRKDTVRAQLVSQLAAGPIDLERIRGIGPLVDGIARSPASASAAAGKASGSSGAVTVITIVVALGLIFLFLVLLFRRKPRGGYTTTTSSSYESTSTWSSSASSSDSSWSSGSSDGGSSGGSDYSGGGGDSGGGGASDSW